MYQRISLFILLFIPIISLAETLLTQQEQAVVQQINKNLPHTLLELEKAVNINSGSMNLLGVKKVGDLALAQYQAIGFDTQWLSGKAFDRAGHLQASKISQNPDAIKVLMIGHLDTVFAKNDNFQRFTKISDEKISGPGIVDMKGGNAIIFAALEAMHQQNLLNNISIKVLLTGDEESSGRPLSLSKKAIIDAAKWADVALGFESGDSDIRTAMAARRGYTGWTLDISAKPAHSSQIFRKEVGSGAIYEAARILNEFREQLSSKENLTFNPGMILGGTQISHDKSQSSGNAFGKSNVIAQSAKVTGDIRTLSKKQLIKAQRSMQEIVAKNLPHSKATLVFHQGYPPMAFTEGNKKLLALYSKVSQDLGYQEVVAANPRKAGAADISFAVEHVDMALDGLGMMGSGGHTKMETANISSLHINAEKTAILLLRLSQ